MRTDKKFLQEIKLQYSGGLGLRRGRNLITKKQENKVKTRRQEREIAKNKSTKPETEKNNGKKIYNCKFCKKVFDTPFGRSVHVRSHKRCQGCKKEFPFPSVLKYHKPSCEKLRTLLAKEALHNNTPNSKSCEEKMTSPSEKHVSIKKAHSPSSSRNKSAMKNDEFTKMHCCTHCNKRFSLRCKLKRHMSFHTGDKYFTCSVCPKKLNSNQALKYHLTRMHKDQVNPSETNGDFAWTKPLEDIEENQEDLVSTSINTRSTITCNNVVKKCRPLRLGNSDGFICFLCQKFVKTKHQMIEHFRLHTGEKPVKCEKCLRRFRTRAQLSYHRKRCH